MTRNRKGEYVMQKLMYFLDRFTPAQRADFLRRAIIETSKLPGGLDFGGVAPDFEVNVARPSRDTEQSALSAPRRRPIGRSTKP
jgi:hypothetical protein